MSAIEAVWPAAGSANMSDGSDLDLVQRARVGDAEAFGELVRRHERVVYNLAYRFMRNAAQAEDMAQEAFVKAYRSLHGFRGDCRFSSWLYRVTCSICLTELNRIKRRGEVETYPETDSRNAAQASAAPSALDVSESSEMAELVRCCVTKLPERYATIITLFYLQELSYEEIAEVLRLPMGTLKTWMHRARHELKTIVEKEMGQP